MSKKFLQSVFSLLLLAGMLFSLAQPVSAGEAPQAAPQGLDKVEPAVLNVINAKGASDYVVVLKEQADLSAAYSMPIAERRQYVYETLKATADRSQAPLKAYLDERGIKYQSFFNGNEIAVTGGDLQSVTTLASRPDVQHIRYPRTVTIQPLPRAVTVQAAPTATMDWGITDTGANQFWATFGQGEGIVVANIDTGVQWDHPALDQAYKCASNPSSPSCWLDPGTLDCSGTGGGPCDNNGHGTHTMGTMVGDDDPSLTYTVGMAPGSTWIACKGCATNSCSDTDLNACADWVLAPGGSAANAPDVVNNSWGGGGGDTWYQTKVQAWRAAGIFPAFSAGNSGPSCSTLGSPGDYQESFASASHQQSRAISSFSSRGPSAAFGHDPYTKPNISAPGDLICSSVPGSSWDCTYSGTSMASPHTAGAVALLWACNPSLIGNMTATFEALQNTADTPPAGTCGAPPDGQGNYTFGYGYLNVYAAGLANCGDTGTLTGTVTSGGNPVSGALVTADDGAGHTKTITTAANGTFSTTLITGTYTVSATKYGYDTDVVTGVVITDGGTTNVDLLLSPVPMDTVSGYVYDDSGHGYPLYASLNITAPGLDETIYTNPFTGYYEIELAHNTPHTFVVNAVPTGYLGETVTVTPTADPFSQDFYLEIDETTCSAPGYAPSYDIFYNFESSNHGFTTGGTTSFAWGDFTSGPMAGHSGSKGIATNPSGNYNASEEGWMVSPAIDLTSFGTDTPVIEWYDWKHIESATYDWARVDVTKDGGTTWTPVWGPIGGVSDTAYQKQTIILDPTYNVANFQIRFYFKSDTSVQYEGWYVDDIGIFKATVPPPTVAWSNNFDTDNGGFVAGGTSSSWAWGAPSATPGPGAAHSAPNVWATNLSGNYNNGENSYITSPTIDLSTYTGLAPTIAFWHWYQSESNTYDWGSVEASKDGGATWNTIWQKFGTSVSPWSYKTLQLDPSYAVSNFQFRFHFQSDSSVSYPGWYIDDVSVLVSTPVSFNVSCEKQSGAVAAGYVTDANTTNPLVGANVATADVAVKSFALTGDPANAGLYWFFQPTTVSPTTMDVTASMAKYSDKTHPVTFVWDTIVRQDFALDAGLLSAAPSPLEVTMTTGDPATTRTLTLSNAGGAAANFELVEKDEGVTPLSIPAFTGSLPEDTRPVSIGPAPEALAASKQPGSDSTVFTPLVGEPAYAINLGSNTLYYIPNTTTPGTWTSIGTTEAQLFAGDFLNGDFTTLYAISYANNNLYTVNTATGAATLVGPSTPPAGLVWTGLTGAPDGTLYGVTTNASASNLVTVDPDTGAVTDLGPLAGVAGAIDLAYSTEDGMIYIVDIVSDHLFRVDPDTLAVTDVGALGANANYAQGMDFEEETGILYWAAYTTTGELRVIDTTTGASSLVGAFSGGAEVDAFAFATGGTVDVPWLSESPVSGSVPAGGSTPVTVTFDPTLAGVTEPGHYHATLTVKNNTPYGKVTVPVTLHLQPTASMGTLNGTISGLGICDQLPAAPIQGAVVNIYDQSANLVATYTTGADGYYSRSLNAGIYDVEVIATDFVSQTIQDVTVTASQTTVQNVTMRRNAPCLSAAPTSLTATQLPDSTTTQTLVLTNSGAGPATFDIVELPGALMALMDQLIQDPSFELYTPNPVWDEFSSTYGTPLCTAADCGTGTGTGPHTGTVWAWFGGSSAGDQGYVSQPVTIEPGTATMTFWVEQMVCGDGGASNYLRLLVDTTEVWRTDGTDPACGVLGYRQITVDLSSFADGSSHLIKFDSVTVGSGNFFLDDVQLNLDPFTDVPWLSEDPVSGTIPADSTLTVDVTFDSTGLAVGDYNAVLRIKNLPYPNVNVPVTLHVVNTLIRHLYLPSIMK